MKAVAYRWIVRWMCGCLGWDNARPLPACVYNKVRSQYPTTSTHGFSSSTERASL